MITFDWSVYRGGDATFVVVVPGRAAVLIARLLVARDTASRPLLLDLNSASNPELVRVTVEAVDLVVEVMLDGATTETLPAWQPLHAEVWTIGTDGRSAPRAIGILRARDTLAA